MFFYACRISYNGIMVMHGTKHKVYLFDLNKADLIHIMLLDYEK